MDYNEHLDRYQAKQRELAQEAEERKQRQLVALQECFSEADQIIHAVILPELDRLRAALVAHEIPAKLTVSRDVSDLSPDSTFDVEIELREDIHPGNPRRGIVFTAIPHGKYFTVKKITSRDLNGKPSTTEMKFAEATADRVKDICGRFLAQAFTF